MSPDPAALADALARTLRDTFRQAGFRRGVVGLAGRADETAVAALAAKALGAANLRLLILVDPDDEAGAADLARAAADHVEGETETVDLEPFLEALLDTAPEADPTRRHGFLARVRTALLYDRSRAHRALVIAAASKSDRLLGRDTLQGEGAGAVNPVGDLYATEVLALARHLGVPDEILGPPAVVELPAGSASGGSFEPTYAWVDPLLRMLVDERLRPRELTDQGYDRADVKRVTQALRRSRYRLRPTVVPAVSDRPV